MPPDYPVAALRSVALSTPDLETARAFYTETWQLELVAQAPGRAYLAASGDDAYVLELRAGARASLDVVSFRVRAVADLPRLYEACVQAGCTILQPPGPDHGPAGGTHFIVREPQGCTLEFLHGDARREGAIRANRPLRLAHVNINSAAIEDLSRFWQEVLGFRLTDRSQAMAFLSCNSDHHAIVLAQAPVNGLNHVAFLLPDLESVMRGAGHVVDHGCGIGWGPGRHGPGDNVFAYFVGPDDVVVEYTAEVLQVDESYRFRGPQDWVWPPGRTDHWGVAPPKTAACKAAQLAIGFADAPGFPAIGFADAPGINETKVKS